MILEHSNTVPPPPLIWSYTTTPVIRPDFRCIQIEKKTTELPPSRKVSFGMSESSDLIISLESKSEFFFNCSSFSVSIGNPILPPLHVEA
jgi:hypothetical protein